MGRRETGIWIKMTKLRRRPLGSVRRSPNDRGPSRSNFWKICGNFKVVCTRMMHLNFFKWHWMGFGIKMHFSIIIVLLLTNSQPGLMMQGLKEGGDDGNTEDLLRLWNNTFIQSVLQEVIMVKLIPMTREHEINGNICLFKTIIHTWTLWTNVVHLHTK